MVDPVEVKLDEIGAITERIERTQERQAKESEKAAASLRKAEEQWNRAFDKETLAGLKGSLAKGADISKIASPEGGGLFSMFKGLLSKQLPASISMGMTAGLAAGGVMLLAQIIGEAISNSKILMTVLGTIGKALGLLIDVILLPFLPILTTGIIWLFQGIMLFHKLWNGIWNAKTFQNIVLAVGRLADLFVKGVGFLVELGVQALLGVGAGIWMVITWLYGLATGGGKIALDFIFDAVSNAFWGLINWLFDVSKMADGMTIKFALDIMGAVGNLLQWLMDSVKTGIKLDIEIVPKIVETANAGFQSIPGLKQVNDLGASIGGWISGATSQTGGGSPSGGTSTINIFGYTDQKLKSVVEDILRVQNNRYNT